MNPQRINISINKSEIPFIWKQAVITPLPKITHISSVRNLHPISVSPVYSEQLSSCALGPWRHSCVVPWVVYELTICCFIMRSVYREKSMMMKTGVIVCYSAPVGVQS